MAVDESRVRSIKKLVEEDASAIDNLVTNIVQKYNRDLHDFITRAKELLDGLKDGEEISDYEIENLTLKIPIYMYFASSGLETLGIEGDSAKAIKMEAANKVYLEVVGTIPDKQKAAELATMPEYLVEIAFTRAYKKLKVQVEMAELVFSGVKKILSKRMLEIEVGQRELGYIKREED